MRTVTGFNLRRVGNENIIVPGNTGNVDFTNIISLNESAAKLWKEIEGKEFTAETLTGLLLQWYNTDESTASTDARNLIEAWLKAGLIEE